MNRLIAVVMLAVAVAILLGTLVGINFPLNRRSASLTNSSGTANNSTSTNPSSTTVSSVQPKLGASTTSATPIPENNIVANTTNATPAATTSSSSSVATSPSPTPSSAVDSTSAQQPVKALW